MEFYYAELNEQKICTGIKQVASEMTEINIVPIDTYDISLLGQRYNNGTWDSVEISPEPLLVTLTETEQAILDTAINIEYLVSITELKI